MSDSEATRSDAGTDDEAMEEVSLHGAGPAAGQHQQMSRYDAANNRTVNDAEVRAVANTPVAFNPHTPTYVMLQVSCHLAVSLSTLRQCCSSRHG